MHASQTNILSALSSQGGSKHLDTACYQHLNQGHCFQRVLLLLEIA